MKRMGSSAILLRKRLDLAQALYEKHKVITYPRTSSNYVTEETIPVMGNVLKMLKQTSYGDLASGQTEAVFIRVIKRYAILRKVEDHHAILPTPKRPGTLSEEEQNIYDLIVRRFLSHYYPPAVYNNHEVMTQVAEELFRMRAKQQLDQDGELCLRETTGAAPRKKRAGRRNPMRDRTIKTMTFS